MNIHHTHTRKSLIDIIGIYDFNKFPTLMTYKKLKKDILCKALSDILLILLKLFVFILRNW